MENKRLEVPPPTALHPSVLSYIEQQLANGATLTASLSPNLTQVVVSFKYGSSTTGFTDDNFAFAINHFVAPNAPHPGYDRLMAELASVADDHDVFVQANFTLAQLKIMTAVLRHYAALSQETTARQKKRTFLENVQTLTKGYNIRGLRHLMKQSLNALSDCLRVECYMVQFVAYHCNKETQTVFTTALAETFPATRRYIRVQVTTESLTPHCAWYLFVLAAAGKPHPETLERLQWILSSDKKAKAPCVTECLTGEAQENIEQGLRNGWKQV